MSPLTPSTDRFPPIMSSHRTIRACLTLLPLLLAACASTDPASRENWLKPSPTLAQTIDQKAERMAWTHNLEDRVELIQWFAGVGEPAYPKWLELAEDERPHVAGSALAALGATGDPSLIKYIREIHVDRDDQSLRLEHARALANLGDWGETRVLIDALRSEQPYTRAVAARTLRNLTGQSLGYDARAEEGEREQAVQRWERWWAASQSFGSQLEPVVQPASQTR